MPPVLAATRLDILDLTAVNWVVTKVIKHADVVQYVREKFHPLSVGHSTSAENKVERAILGDMKKRADGAYQSLTTLVLPNSTWAKISSNLNLLNSEIRSKGKI